MGGDAAFLTGGGQAGAIVRSMDWSATLGAPLTWSQPLRTLVSVLLSSNQPMFVVWGDQRTLIYNDPYADILASKHPAAMGRDLLDVWSDVRTVIEPLVLSAMSGTPVQVDDIALMMERRGFPEEAHFSFSYSPVRDDTGEVRGIFCTCSEITAKVAAGRKAEAERQRQRLMLQHMPGFVALLVGPEHRFSYVNDACVALLGPRDFVGNTVREVLPEIEGQGFFELLDEVYQTGQPFITTSAVLHLREEKERRVVELLYHPVRDDSGAVTGIFVGGYDVTDKVRTEEQLRRLNETLEQRVAERSAELERAQEALRQSQKLEAMGQLTGGVAHDFNNLLTPILGTLDLLRRRAPLDERTQRLVAGAMASAERARTLVQRLLAFARRQPLHPAPVDVGRVVRGIADLIVSTSGPRIRVEIDAPDDLPPVLADANQLEMAVLNLAVNSRDAMPDGGRLSVRAGLDRVGASHESRLPPGHWMCIAVTDTGVGMDEETLRRSIEPFFSTKGVGRGTGLGLSMVHGLASQLGGALTLRSRPGFGTTVELWLPLADTAAAEDDHTASGGPALTPTGTALLVDDEDMVRAATANMLAQLGYDVVEAKSAEHALSVIAEGLRPNLLVSDYLMPGLTGVELAREVQERIPGMPVLIVTGYAEDDIPVDLSRLSKPFVQDDLRVSIGRLVVPANGRHR